jgi:hypothetical protein
VHPLAYFETARGYEFRRFESGGKDQFKPAAAANPGIPLNARCSDLVGEVGEELGLSPQAVEG